MIDERHLLDYRIPEIRQKVTRRDSAFYALSVGLGTDPTDTRQLDYVDADRPGFQVLPCMAEVLCYPGFWLANPDTGVDAVKVVHGEQAVEWFRPLPTDGELVGNTRVTRLIDKGEGKGALLFSTKEVHDAGRGELLFRTERCTFLRGDGGFGGSNELAPKPHTVPETEPDFQVSLETRPEQALYYRLNGDNNPLHADPAVAERAGFPRPILHGLCTFGVVFHALLRQFNDYRPAASGRIKARFSAPVFPGETIRTEIWKDGSFRARVVERDLVVINNGFVQFN
jgi:Acyl dehydratase